MASKLDNLEPANKIVYLLVSLVYMTCPETKSIYDNIPYSATIKYEFY